MLLVSAHLCRLISDIPSSATLTQLNPMNLVNLINHGQAWSTNLRQHRIKLSKGYILTTIPFPLLTDKKKPQSANNIDIFAPNNCSASRRPYHTTTYHTYIPPYGYYIYILLIRTYLPTYLGTYLLAYAPLTYPLTASSPALKKNQPAFVLHLYRIIVLIVPYDLTSRCKRQKTFVYYRCVPVRY
ncbi:hypothetical protein F5Y11DRAFT_269517 [Daldinia sp. FL1419]|nr:hypothetical protein F5Y11DRAFT_269517 [Daldinia sp. FL1419]